MQAAQLDPRIGVLNSGRFYAFVNGLDKPETVGTREEVERALGVAAKAAGTSAPLKTFDVVMHFEHPAWDEVDGISYPGIQAASKAQANSFARSQARRDGHAVGRGRYWFAATEV
ncbi:hypothetical protein [Comamonas testosteroni]|uniref:hypothetical protein n=1 Tax=Comamonas testosteroni TaxID=285 RepID=UPI0026E99AB8|nr:hypothetical protein [Comamonas testosteroni]